MLQPPLPNAMFLVAIGTVPSDTTPKCFGSGKIVTSQYLLIVATERIMMAPILIGSGSYDIPPHIDSGYMGPTC